ncbi:S-layer protein, partial [Paenarthrobacter sp.]|uniref:TolB family protein n=1 Tax=Paenarthrobacter sp. TaxID=1931993 RepID=UPI0028123553
VVRDPGGNTLVKTKPATLPEAVVSTGGLLEVSGTPVSSEFIPEPDVVVEPDAAPTATRPDMAQPFAEATADIYSRSFAWKKTFKSESKSPNLTGTGSLTVESSIKASAKAKMTLETGFLSLKEASVVVTPSTSASHSIKVGGTLEGEISAPLGELNSVFTFMAGPVPVVVTTELGVAANLTVEGAAQIAFTSSQTVSSDHGFKYRDGSFNLINTKPSSNGVQNTVKASASLTAKASLDFDAKVKLYGIVGITFGAGPFVSAAIEVTNSGEGFQWSCPIELGFAARLGIAAGINIMGINLGEWTDTTTTGWTLHVANPCEGKPVVAPEPDPEPTPTPTPTPTSTPTSTPGTIDLVHLTPGGTPGSGMPFAPVVSADGRYVAFVSASADLAPGMDSNDQEDLFVRDMVTGAVQLISATPAGNAANAWSHEPSISADGRFVVFTSSASNLVAGDTNGVDDVFIRDLEAGITTLVSVTPNGATGSGRSYQGSVSADGRFVAFTSNVGSLVSGDTNNSADVFVRDMNLGSTVLVSATSAGTVGNGSSSGANISADGRHVAFSSTASGMTPHATNKIGNLFVRNLAAQTTQLVSVSGEGHAGDNLSHSPSMSADGRFIAFGSYASNLVPGKPGATNGVLLRDMTSGTTSLVSVPPSGNGWSHSPSISGDGRFVSFISLGIDMITGEEREAEDVYVRDMTTGITKLVSVTPSGASLDEWHIMQSISGDGRFVVFSVFGQDLLPPDQPPGVGVFRSMIA